MQEAGEHEDRGVKRRWMNKGYRAAVELSYKRYYENDALNCDGYAPGVRRTNGSGKDCLQGNREGNDEVLLHAKGWKVLLQADEEDVRQVLLRYGREEEITNTKFLLYRGLTPRRVMK